MQPGHRAILTLLAIIAGIMGLAEVLSRVVIPRAGTVEGRIVREHRAVLEPPPPGTRRILAVGNSMLLRGVDFPAFQAGLPSGWDARRFVVEATQYNDWYFGLRRLFQEGLQCDVVMVTLSARSFTGTPVRGGYFARRLMMPGDVFMVSRRLQMTPTQSADLLLSSVSEFQGIRAKVRSSLLLRLIPRMDRLLGGLDGAPIWRPNRVEMRELTRQNLLALQDLAAEHKAQVVLFIPPVRDGPDGAEAAVEAGVEAGIPVLLPIPSGGISRDLFFDDVHMDPAGAAILTPALLRDFLKVLPR